MRLPEYLAPRFLDDPLVLVDIGARGGLHERWQPLGESLKAYCFDADAKECVRLAGTDDRAVFIPQAIGAGAGTATLYKTKHKPSSGLYRTNEQFFGRLLNHENAALVSTETVQTISLDQARSLYNLPEPDFIKVDVEGAELDILSGADLGCVFGVYAEFRFHRAINGCPTFADLDRHMTSRGFMLYDIQVGRQSRKDLPYKGEPRAWPDGSRRYGLTDHGQVMDGDALYMRDPLLFKMTRNQILKAACLFEIFELKDCAAELLIAREREAEIDLPTCLNLLAGGDFKAYKEQY